MAKGKGNPEKKPDCSKCIHKHGYSPFEVGCPVCQEKLILWNQNFTVKDDQPVTNLYFVCLSCWRMFMRLEGQNMKMVAFKRDSTNDPDKLSKLSDDPEEMTKQYINQTIFLAESGGTISKAITKLVEQSNEFALDSNNQMMYIAQMFLSRLQEQINARMLQFDELARGGEKDG